MPAEAPRPPPAAAADPARAFYGLAILGVVLFGAIYLWRFQPWNLSTGAFFGAPYGRDFVNFWLGGKLALAGDFAPLFDPKLYNARLAELFQRQEDFFVFSYPPHLLPWLMPFGALPYATALALWTLVNMGALMLVVRLLGGGRHAAVLVLLAPASLAMVVFGHFGGLLALAATVLLFFGDRRALLSGLCLAAISVKPQLALVLGLIALALGHWRSVALAVPITGVLVGLSLVLFGLAPWQGFINWTLPFHADLIARFDAQQLKTSVSLYLGLRALGLNSGLAYLLHGLFALVLLAAVLVPARRMQVKGLPAAWLALILLACLLALPYVNHYDLVLIAPALVLAVAAVGPERAGLSPVMVALLWLTPALAPLLGELSLPLAAPMLAIPAALMARQLWAAPVRD